MTVFVQILPHASRTGAQCEGESTKRPACGGTGRRSVAVRCIGLFSVSWPGAH